jgi:hypothetical protein
LGITKPKLSEREELKLLPVPLQFFGRILNEIFLGLVFKFVPWIPGNHWIFRKILVDMKIL